MAADKRLGAASIAIRAAGGAVALVSLIVVGRGMWRFAEKEGRFAFSALGGSYALWGVLVLGGIVVLAGLELRTIAGIAGLLVVAAGIAVGAYVNRVFHNFPCGSRPIWTDSLMLPIFLAPFVSAVLGSLIVVVGLGGQRLSRAAAILAGILGLAVVWIVWQSMAGTFWLAEPCGM